MQPLINIKRIPIEIEVNVQRSEVRPVESAPKPRKSSFPKISISRTDDAVYLKADPVKLDISGKAPVSKAPAKNVDSFTSTPKSKKTSNSQSLVLSYKGYAKVDTNARAIVSASGGGSTGGNDFGGVAVTPEMSVKADKATRSIESILSALPKTKDKTGISFSNGKLSIDYDYNIDDGIDIFDLINSKFEFIPGKIEVIVTQMPKLEIEYTGGPIYFPKSADPNYEPQYVTV